MSAREDACTGMPARDLASPPKISQKARVAHDVSKLRKCMSKVRSPIKTTPTRTRTRGPILSYSQPIAGIVTAPVTAIGRRSRPVRIALRPRMFWTNNGMKNVVVKRLTMTMDDVRVDSVNLR
jgi:hypothetical protein